MSELQMVWGWQPALYLFLGGMGAGTFITAAILHFKTGSETAKVQNTAVWAAIACLVVGLLLLVAELVFPLRGLILWQSFSNFGSWMTYGAWLLFAAVIVFVLAGLCTSRAAGGFAARIAKSDAKEEGTAGALRMLLVVGALLSLAVAFYTGMLLSVAPGVPLWNTPLLPCLFTVSALDTGVALVEVVAHVQRKSGAMSQSVCLAIDKAVVILVVVEAVVLAAFVALALAGAGAAPGSFAATAASSAGMLVGGVLAIPFWVLVIGCGLALPLAVALCGLSKKSSGATALIGALGALVGGCALRFVVLLAGAHIDTVAEFVNGIML